MLPDIDAVKISDSLTDYTWWDALFHLLDGFVHQVMKFFA